LGLLYQDHGDMNEAVKEFQKAIEIDPKYVRGHNNLGVALMRSNRLDAAAAELRVALAAASSRLDRISATPRLLWPRTYFGSISMAFWNSFTASFMSPWSWYSRPR